MDTGYKVRNQNHLHFLTFTTHQWLDIFTRPLYKDVLVDSLRYCQEKKGLELFAWVIMTNHLHLIARAEVGYMLQDIVRDFKKFTSVSIVRSIQENPQESRKQWLLNMMRYAAKTSQKHEKYLVWEVGYHPVELSSNDMINQRLEYLHQNPVKERWVDQPEDYVYSSARDYAGIKGLLDVKFV